MSNSMRAVELLQRFIQFPTVSSDPILPFASEVAERAERLGGTVHRFETSTTKQNIVAQIGPSGSDSIGLSGHMDVVPVEGQDWTMDPFEGLIEKGAVWGRGACDMKAFLASTYSILERFPVQKMKRGMTLIWTHDEEIGCVGASHLPTQCKNIEMPINILIGEPTSQQIFHHHGGHCTLEITVRGKSAHSSKPYLGVSATAWLFEAWGIIRDWQKWLETHPSSITQKPALVYIAQVHAGTAINIIPEHGTIRLGLRPMPGHDHLFLIDNLRERLTHLQKSAEEDGALLELHVIQAAAPLYTPLPTALEQAIQQQRPNTPCTGAPFATDGGCLAEIGTKPLIWGPGSIDVAHQPNEYVKIEELNQYEQALEGILRAWCL